MWVWPSRHRVEVIELGGVQVSRFRREFQPETRVSILQGQVPLTFKASNSCRAWPNQAPCSWASSRCTLSRSTCCAWATSVSTWAVASACSCRSSSSSCWADSGVSEWQLLCLPRTCLVFSLRVLHLGTLFCWATLGPLDTLHVNSSSNASPHNARLPYPPASPASSCEVPELRPGPG